MEQTKEKVKVIMLPTEDTTGIATDSRSESHPKLLKYHNPDKVLSGERRGGFRTNFHLYFTSDEEIKEGDWAINKFGIYQVTATTLIVDVGGRKIIATTSYLTQEESSNSGATSHKIIVPQIPQSFIKEYCEVGGINEVLVEYAMTEHQTEVDESDEYYSGVINYYKLQLKLNSNNEIIIHPIVEKVYTKSDITKLLNDRLNHLKSNLSQMKGKLRKANQGHNILILESKIEELDWIKENLK